MCSVYFPLGIIIMLWDIGGADHFDQLKERYSIGTWKAQSQVVINHFALFTLFYIFDFFFLHFKLDIFYICTDWYTMANLANLYIVQFGSSIISESIQKFTVNQIDVLVFFWWHRIFYYRADIAVVNSSILMNQSKYPEKDNQ